MQRRSNSGKLVEWTKKKNEVDFHIHGCAEKGTEVVSRKTKLWLRGCLGKTRRQCIEDCCNIAFNDSIDLDENEVSRTYLVELSVHLTALLAW